MLATLLCLSVLFSWPAAGQVAEPAPPPSPPERLPEGALVRLGSLDLRHAGPVEWLRFTASGRLLQSRSSLDGLRTWSAEDGSAQAPPPGDAPEPEALAELRAQPQMMVRVAEDDTACCAWSLSDGRVLVGRPGAELHGLDAPAHQIQEACFDEGGGRVVLVGESIRTRSDFATWLRCHDTGDGELIWQAELTGMTPSAAAIAPPHGGLGETLLVAGRDGQVQRVSLEDGGVITSWAAHEVFIAALAGSVPGVVVTGTSHGELAAWSLSDDDPAAEPSAWWKRRAHQTGITSVAVAPDRSLVASGARDHRVRLWSGEDGTLHAEPDTHVVRLTGAAVSAQGDLAVTSDWSGRLGLWSPDGGHPAGNAWIQAHDGRVTGLTLLADPALVLTSGQDGLLALWHLDGSQAGPPVATESAVLALAMSDNGAHVATSGGDRRVLLWSVVAAEDGSRTLAPRGELATGAGTSQSLAYLPDGEALAIGTSQVRLVAARDGAVRWETSVRAPVADMSVSPDGRLLAAGLASRAVVVLDTEDGRELWRWGDHPGRVTAVAFSPDGRHVAAAGGDALVRIREVDGPAEITTLDGHLGEVTSLSWGADGVLVSASADGTALFWRP
jgi:WD40 repeat protein